MVVTARRVVLAIVAFGGGGLCACTLLVGVPGGLTGGSTGDASDDGPAGDAPVRDGPGAEGGPGDTGSPVEAGADTGGPRDGGADAAEAGPYPAGSWCAMQPQQGLVLCDDFDQDTLAFSRWTTQDFGVGGSSGFSMTHVSAPYSLEINVPPHTSSTFFLEVLEQDVPGTLTQRSTSLDFEFQPVSWPDAGADADQTMTEMYVASLAQGPGAPRVAITIFTGPGGTQLQEQDTDSMGNDTFNNGPWMAYTPPSGTFTHFTVSIAYGETATAMLQADGVSLGTLQLTGDWLPTATTSVFLGDWYVTTTPGFEWLYDDAVIRQQ